MSWEAMERGSGRFENITNTADCMDQFGLKRIVHLRPQAAHYHVDYVRIGFETYVAHNASAISSRYSDPARMRQMCEQENSFGVRFSGIPPRSAR